MLKYVDTELPCPTLSISKMPQDFLRSSIPYVKEQSAYGHNHTNQAFVVIVDKVGVSKFLEFWLDLNEGISWFECDFLIAGIKGTKKARFITPHKIEQLSLNLFRVSTAIEMEIK